MSDLKICPFCGGKAEMLIAPPALKDKPSKWLVICKNQCVNQSPHKSEEDARNAWNRRVNDDFLNFLWNTINPNQMEEYLSMYESHKANSNRPVR